MHRMDGAALVSAYLERSHINQAELAQRAKISQATISRALARKPSRRSAASERLFTYIHENMPPPPQAVDALSRVWDGTDMHAAALANLILASNDLWPGLRAEQNGE